MEFMGAHIAKLYTTNSVMNGRPQRRHDQSGPTKAQGARPSQSQALSRLTYDHDAPLKLCGSSFKRFVSGLTFDAGRLTGAQKACGVRRGMAWRGGAGRGICEQAVSAGRVKGTPYADTSPSIHVPWSSATQTPPLPHRIEAVVELQKGMHFRHNCKLNCTSMAPRPPARLLGPRPGLRKRVPRA